MPPRRPLPRQLPLRALLLLALLLPAACTPAAQRAEQPSQRPPLDEARLNPLSRTAWEAWLLMEIQLLRTGLYGTQVLQDLALPPGVRWTVVEFSGDDYALVVTHDGDDQALRVDPDGVRPVP